MNVFTSATRFLVVLAFALLAAASTTIDAAARSPGDRQLLRFKKWPHLRCSTCIAVVDVIGHLMNKSLKESAHATVQMTHRLNRQNKIERVDYASSSLASVELMEKACSDKDNFRDFHLREQSRTGLPVYSRVQEEDMIHVVHEDDEDFYPKQSDTSKLLKESCDELVAENEDFLVPLLRKERQFDALVDKFCGNRLKYCGSAAYDKAARAAQTRHDAWKKKRAPRNPTKVDVERREEEAKAEQEREAAARDERIRQATDPNRPRDITDEYEEVEVEVEVDDDAAATDSATSTPANSADAQPAP